MSHGDISAPSVPPMCGTASTGGSSGSGSVSSIATSGIINDAQQHQHQHQHRRRFIGMTNGPFDKNNSNSNSNNEYCAHVLPCSSALIMATKSRHRRDGAARGRSHTPNGDDDKEEQQRRPPPNQNNNDDLGQMYASLPSASSLHVYLRDLVEVHTRQHEHQHQQSSTNINMRIRNSNSSNVKEKEGGNGNESVIKKSISKASSRTPTNDQSNNDVVATPSLASTSTPTATTECQSSSTASSWRITKAPSTTSKRSRSRPVSAHGSIHLNNNNMMVNTINHNKSSNGYGHISSALLAPSVYGAPSSSKHQRDRSTRTSTSTVASTSIPSSSSSSSWSRLLNTNTKTNMMNDSLIDKDGDEHEFDGDKREQSYRSGRSSISKSISSRVSNQNSCLENGIGSDNDGALMKAIPNGTKKGDHKNNNNNEMKNKNSNKHRQSHSNNKDDNDHSDLDEKVDPTISTMATTTTTAMAIGGVGHVGVSMSVIDEYGGATRARSLRRAAAAAAATALIEAEEAALIQRNKLRRQRIRQRILAASNAVITTPASVSSPIVSHHSRSRSHSDNDDMKDTSNSVDTSSKSSTTSNDCNDTSIHANQSIINNNRYKDHPPRSSLSSTLAKKKERPNSWIVRRVSDTDTNGSVKYRYESYNNNNSNGSNVVNVNRTSGTRSSTICSSMASSKDEKIKVAKEEEGQNDNKMKCNDVTNVIVNDNDNKENKEASITLNRMCSAPIAPYVCYYLSSASSTVKCHSLISEMVGCCQRGWNNTNLKSLRHYSG
jgi:hypothetical protein